MSGGAVVGATATEATPGLSGCAGDRLATAIRSRAAAKHADFVLIHPLLFIPAPCCTRRRHGLSWRALQLVEPHRIVVEQLALDRGRAAARDPLEGVPQHRVAAGQRIDRKITF